MRPTVDGYAGFTKQQAMERESAEALSINTKMIFFHDNAKGKTITFILQDGR